MKIYKLPIASVRFDNTLILQTFTYYTFSGASLAPKHLIFHLISFILVGYQEDKDKNPLFNVAYNVTDNISS